MMQVELEFVVYDQQFLQVGFGEIFFEVIDGLGFEVVLECQGVIQSIVLIKVIVQGVLYQMDGVCYVILGQLFVQFVYVF